MSTAEIGVVRSFAELEALAPEWSVLSERFGTPLLDHDWFACAARALHREADLRVVTVRIRGVLAAAAPMVVDASGRHLTLIGSSVLYEPGAWLFASDQALRELAGAAAAMGHVIVLDRIPADSALCRMLPRMMRWRALTIRRKTANSFLVDTHRPWEAYCATLAASARRKFGAKRRKAERAFGSARFERLAPAPADVEALLDRLIRVEASGWKGRNGSALARRPDLSTFFRTYSLRAAAAGRLRVSTLWFGDEVAAMQLGVEAYHRMWSLKIGYDERFAVCAPGLQLAHASIEAAHRIGLEGYEFLGSAESWQERWRPSRRHYELAAMYPFTPSALGTAVRDVGRRLARRSPVPTPTEDATADGSRPSMLPPTP